MNQNARCNEINPAKNEFWDPGENGSKFFKDAKGDKDTSGKNTNEKTCYSCKPYDLYILGERGTGCTVPRG
jgi:hypothetical protein